MTTRKGAAFIVRMNGQTLLIRTMFTDTPQLHADF